MTPRQRGGLALRLWGDYDQQMTLLLAANDEGLNEAARLLREGGLVAFPTETVYGLGADATNGKAVAGIYEAKGRPSFNPLIVHAASLEQAETYGLFDERARTVARAFWPGPLTLVLPVRKEAGLSSLALAGLETVGLRVPAHPLARAMIARSGKPIAGPSANRSGHVSPTSAAHVMADLAGRIDAVLDGGPCPVGVESSILDLTGATPRLLRPGGLATDQLDALIGPVERFKGQEIIAPGMMASHYAPKAKVRLDALALEEGEALLGFGPDMPQAALSLNLSPSGDLSEAAANLFAYLRALDDQGAASIAVAPIPAHGLGEAIRDRLQRAAAEK